MINGECNDGNLEMTKCRDTKKIGEKTEGRL